jgi:hypothetical protein
MIAILRTMRSVSVRVIPATYKSKQIPDLMSAWCSGYHICLTHRRSPVQSWALICLRLSQSRLVPHCPSAALPLLPDHIAAELAAETHRLRGAAVRADLRHVIDRRLAP